MIQKPRLAATNLHAYANKRPLTESKETDEKVEAQKVDEMSFEDINSRLPADIRAALKMDAVDTQGSWKTVEGLDDLKK